MKANWIGVVSVIVTAGQAFAQCHEWTRLSEGMNNIVTSLCEWDPDGNGPLQPRLVAGGAFTTAGGVSANHIASWNGLMWEPIGSGMNGDVYAVTTWDPDGAGPIVPQLVAAGGFTTSGGITVNNIARWDGSAWQPFGAGMNSIVLALSTWDPDGSGPLTHQIVAGGWFTQAGGAPTNYIARWDGAAWQPVLPAPDFYVFALGDWDPDGGAPLASELVGGGAFNTVGNTTVNNIARWGGSVRTFGSGMNNWVEALTTWDPDGLGSQLRQVVAGGFFSTAGGIMAWRIARWDGNSWQNFGTGMDGAVFDLTTWDPDGIDPLNPQIVAGGEFSSAGGVPVGYIARWDGSAWQSIGVGGSGMNDRVRAVASWDPDGSGPLAPQLIAGGDFTTAGGETVNRIAAWAPCHQACGECVPSWASRYDATGTFDGATAIRVDLEGNAYVTGSSQSGSSISVLTVKYDATGQQRWASRYATNSNENAFPADMALDGQGNVVISGGVGTASGSNYLTIKYRGNDGSQLWATQYSAFPSGNEGAEGVAVDTQGDVYVTGGSGQAANSDFATIKYNRDTGNQVWAQRYDRAGQFDLGEDIAVDEFGNVFVTGGSLEPFAPCSSSREVYVTIKYRASDGLKLWAISKAGPGCVNKPVAMALNETGDIYVTGRSDASTTSASDYLTVKYQSSGGQQLWEARMNGSGNGPDEPTDIGVDGAGNVVVTGWSTNVGADIDYLTVKYSSAGIERWRRYYSGMTNGGDSANSLAIDAQGNVFVTGESAEDYATVKYDVNGVELCVERYDSSSVDIATDVGVDNQGHFYVTGTSVSSVTQSDYATLKYGSATIVPAIMHGPAPVGETIPCSGYIDPRRESHDGVNLNEGLTSAKIRFNTEVFKSDGSDIDKWDFSLIETGGGAPPTILSATYVGEDKTHVKVVWNRPITLREWTTVIAHVYDGCGTPIESHGNLGPGVNEPDRIDIGFLPGDVDQSANVSPLDLIAFKQAASSGAAPPTSCGGVVQDYVDIDRNGIINPLDLLYFKRLINGLPPSTRSWQGKTMLHPRP